MFLVLLVLAAVLVFVFLVLDLVLVVIAVAAGIVADGVDIRVSVAVADKTSNAHTMRTCFPFERKVCPTVCLMVCLDPLYRPTTFIVAKFAAI